MAGYEKSKEDIEAAMATAGNAWESAHTKEGGLPSGKKKIGLLEDARANWRRAENDYKKHEKNYGSGHDMSHHGEGKPFGKK